MRTKKPVIRSRDKAVAIERRRCRGGTDVLDAVAEARHGHEPASSSAHSGDGGMRVSWFACAAR